MTMVTEQTSYIIIMFYYYDVLSLDLCLLSNCFCLFYSQWKQGLMSMV